MPTQIDAATRTQQALLAVLDAAAQHPTLSRDYVVKGGLALYHAYGSPRRSDDVDFTCVKPFSAEVTDEKNELLIAFCRVLDEAMASVAAKHGYRRMAVYEQTLSREIPANLTLIGVWAEADPRKEPPDFEVEMQVTLSEEVCEGARVMVQGIPLHVPVIEDILAGKLKALLQQVHRKKPRSVDVYDIWYFTAMTEHEVDPAKVMQYLQIKCGRWPHLLPLRRAMFRDEGLREYAASEYGRVFEEVEDVEMQVPFEEAFAHYLRFVEELPLAE